MTCIYCNIFHCYLQYNVATKYKNCNTKIAVDFSLNENVCVDYYEKKKNNFRPVQVSQTRKVSKYELAMEI